MRRLGFSLFKTVTNSVKACKTLSNEPEDEADDDDDDDDDRSSRKTAPAGIVTGDLSQADLDATFDFIVCDELLQDMDVLAFVKLLKSDPKYPTLPFLALTSTPSVKDALSAAGVATLSRPYSLDHLERSIISAAYYFRGPLKAERLREQEELLQKKQAKTHSVADLHKTAIALMQQKRLPEGEKILLHVLKLDKNHIPSYLALCQLYMAIKNGQKLNRCLLKAVVACVRQGDMNRAKAFAAKLPEALRKGNLVRVEADFLLRDGDYQGAAATYLDAYATQPEDALYAYLVKACGQSPSPNKNFQELCTAFAQNGHVSLARRMEIRRLKHMPPKNAQTMRQAVPDFG